MVKNLNSSLKFLIILSIFKGPVCPQLEVENQDEDCLRLNVYTPIFPDEQSSCNITILELMPVVAYIGGTRLLTGGSNTKMEGPGYLLDDDIVLVTINYRLGALGFLSTGTEDAPGNNGFKDQVMALHWIRENIKQFGGDPNKVTLMGWSAGAMSAMLHLVSPMSEGLFHRAIIMSGSIPPQIKLPTNQLDVTQKQAELVNCTRNKIKNMMHCLRRRSAQEIVTTTENFYEYFTNPWYIWYPVIEPDFGQERFLTANPYNLIKSGNFSRVPIIHGNTEHEMVSLVHPIFESDKERSQWDRDEKFNELAEKCLMLKNITEGQKRIFTDLFRKYINTGSDHVIPHNFNGMIRMFSDAIINFGVDHFKELAYGFTKIFFYRSYFRGHYNKYRDDSTLGFSETERICKEVLSKKNYISQFFYLLFKGVSHGDDKVQIFEDQTNRLYEARPERENLNSRCLQYWIHFIKKGYSIINSQDITCGHHIAKKVYDRFNFGNFISTKWSRKSNEM